MDARAAIVLPMPVSRKLLESIQVTVAAEIVRRASRSATRLAVSARYSERRRLRSRRNPVAAALRRSSSLPAESERLEQEPDPAVHIEIAVVAWEPETKATTTDADRPESVLPSESIGSSPCSDGHPTIRSWRSEFDFHPRFSVAALEPKQDLGFPHRPCGSASLPSLHLMKLTVDESRAVFRFSLASDLRKDRRLDENEGEEVAEMSLS